MDYSMPLVVILLLSIIAKLSSSSEVSRSLDLSWRPLSHSPYQQQFFQNGPAGSLITYSHFDAANKDDIVEAAKHNAKVLKKFKEAAHQPITSYSDPYQLYSHTPGPIKSVTAALLNQNVKHHQKMVQSQVPAASSHVLSMIPHPGKSGSLYQTKLNFLGKPDGNAIFHQNSIHQTIGTTPKVAGFTKEHGRVNFHYHHPSFGVTAMSTTKRNPMFSSSVTPHHYATKMHPVMNKFQAHMALAAAAHSQHHQKLKHQHNFGFTPPSQLMSNYASFGPATSNPFWHTGAMKNNNPSNNPFPAVHDNNRDFHHHFHNLQSAQPNHQQNQQQQNLPNVHPSVITPFLDQVRLKQKEAAGAEQKNAFKQSHESNSQEINSSFEIINDVFSKHLVPPPNLSPSSFKPRPSVDKPEKINKYNLSMPSPLQDASRFNYNHVSSTATPPSVSNFKPSASDNSYQSTEKPNVFINLNRTKDNVYKQHKLLHPSYTGGQRIRPSVVANIEKPFLPTPYRPEKEEEQLRNDYQPQYNFFTIEDAVTPNLSYEIIKSHIPVKEEHEDDDYVFQRRPEYEHSTQAELKTSTTTAAPIESSTQKPRQKLRRRKPKPQQQHQQIQPQQQQPQAIKESNEVQVTEKPSYKPNRLRGSIKNVDTQTEQSDLRTRNRVNHPSRVRSRFTIPSTSATSTTPDFDSTILASVEEEKQDETASTHKVTTENYTSVTSGESSEQPENVKRRVRLRFKNKLRANPMETADFKPKLNDNQIADTENENFVIKQSDETTESTATESGINEIRSSLKLPNLKLRNDALTTLPTTANTISTSAEPSSTKGIEPEETNNILNKIANRPRFSIKEYKRKQLTTSSTNTPLLTSSTTAVTTSKPDSQRFNRIRLGLNRRRNETNEPERSSDEDYEVPRKRYSSTRVTSTTTESTVQTSSSSKRGSTPKRNFPARNFTKPTVNLNESETTTKSFIKVSTTNRPASPSLRSRIQNYKKKESLNEVTESPHEAIKIISETSVTQEQTTVVSTEPPIKHETSIMKIAKTPPSVEKSPTSNALDDPAVVSVTSSSDFDLTGSPSEHSQRVAELTFSGNDNNFRSANIGPLSRRIPNYFTISTDDPILPIQAFFPQIKTNSDY